MPGRLTMPATLMTLSSGVMAVRRARAQHGGEGFEARGAQRDARLDRRPLALGALGQRLQRQAALVKVLPSTMPRMGTM